MKLARPLGFGLIVTVVVGLGAIAAPGEDRSAHVAHANLDAGITAYEAQDYREAVKQLEIAIVADPKNPEGYFRLGQSHRALGNFRSALKYIRLTLAIEPNHFAALRERGVTLMEAGHTDDAKMALQKLGEKCERVCPEYESLKQELDAVAEKQDG